MVKNWIAIAVVALVPGVLGCNNDPASPTAPTAANLPPAANKPPPAGSILMQGTVPTPRTDRCRAPGLKCWMAHRPD